MVKIGLTDIPEKEHFSLEYFIKERAYLKLLERDILPYLKRKSKKAPTCFISYAWGDRYHEYWVKRFSEMLHKSGIRVLLDRWEVRKGNILNEFVRKIEEVDWVIVVGTKLYLEKYNRRATSPKEKEHVARLEGQLIEYLVRYSTERGNKVVPVLLEGAPEESLPFMLRHKVFTDFSKDDYFGELLKLIHDLYNIDNRDKHFERFIENFRKYAIAAGEHITEEERKLYEKTRSEKIIALDKEIREEIDLYKEEALKLTEELEEGDYNRTELNFPNGNGYPRLHSYIPQAKLNSYVPRVKEQQELRQKLRKEGVCVVYGHGGVGKSTLVAQHGHARKEQQAVWWMQAETQDKLITSYEHIAKELGIKDEQLAQLKQEAKKGPVKYLSELTRKIYNALTDQEEPTLLILDNAVDPSLIDDCLLHRPSFIKVIITTRDKRSFGNYSQIELSSFTLEEGKAYIQQRLQKFKPSEKDIQALIDEVGLIPQKLALATGYMTEISFMSIEKYLNKLRAIKKQGKRAQDKLVLPEASLGLETLNKPSQLMMRYGAYLDPDFIPLSLVINLLGVSEEEKLNPILARLERLSLITIINNGPNKQGIQIHRAIQAACIGWVEENKLPVQALLLSLLHILDTQMPNITWVPSHSWEQGRLYASNVASFLTKARRRLKASPLLAELFDRIRTYTTCVQFNYQEGLKYAKIALKMRHAIYTDNHPQVAASLNNVGRAYQALGQLAEALKYYEQALEMSQTLYTDNHPEVAASLRNIGTNYHALGKYQEALSYHKQALTMRQVIYTDNHPEVASSLYYVGWVYQVLGQHVEALKYLKQALTMRQSIYTGNHPAVAVSLHRIGTIYQDLGQHAEALKYLEQALEMRQALYTDNNPQVAASLNDIGAIYQDLGQYTEALKYLKQALTMRQSIYTGNHPEVASSLNRIGTIYQDLGQHAEALKYLEQALEMRQALYTDNHPQVAASLNDIGAIYQDLGQYTEALKYLEQAVEMYQAIYIGNHPDVSSSLNNIGSVYRHLGKHQEALKYHQQALGMLQTLYLDNHPDMANSLNNIGSVYKHLGNHQEALKYYQSSLKMFEALHPDEPGHSDIQKVKGNIAQLEEETRKAEQDHD